MTAVEAQVVARVADDYRRRGYDVEVEPAANALPAFLHGFHPDLIARKPGDESVVVEVKVGTRTSAAEQLREIAERVNQQPRVAVLTRFCRRRPARPNYRGCTAPVGGRGGTGAKRSSVDGCPPRRSRVSAPVERS
jgi:hypothetical protein